MKSDKRIDCSLRGAGALWLCILFTVLLGFSTRAYAAAPSRITLDRTACTMKSGQTLKLKATVLKKKDKKKKIVWTSGKKSVATVSSKGLIRAKKGGKATITAKIKGTGYKARCRITVGYPVTMIQPESSDLLLFLGERSRIISRVYPVNAANPTLSYVSTNSRIVQVDALGAVTARGEGEADIILKSIDGSEKSATVHVKVKALSGTLALQKNISLQTKKLLTLMEDYSSFIKQYGNLCYKNGSKPVKSYEEAREKAVSGSRIPLNCAAPANWALYELGYLPRGQIYGTAKGFVVTDKTAKALMSRDADFISSGPAMGCCVQTASDLGAIQCGDILSIDISGINHTVVYAGRSPRGTALVYEAGGIAQSAGYANCGCGLLDYSKASYSKYSITEILRFH